MSELRLLTQPSSKSLSANALQQSISRVSLLVDWYLSRIPFDPLHTVQALKLCLDIPSKDIIKRINFMVSEPFGSVNLAAFACLRDQVSIAASTAAMDQRQEATTNTRGIWY